MNPIDTGEMRMEGNRLASHIASLAMLLDLPLQEKLWEYAELLYVEQVAFESSDPGAWTIERESDAFLR